MCLTSTYVVMYGSCARETPWDTASAVVMDSNLCSHKEMEKFFLQFHKTSLTNIRSQWDSLQGSNALAKGCCAYIPASVKLFPHYSTQTHQDVAARNLPSWISNPRKIDLIFQDHLLSNTFRTHEKYTS